MQPRGGNICLKCTKALVFVEKGKIVCEKCRTMSVWVGGLKGGCSKACLFRVSILIYVFWSITCMVSWSLGSLSAQASTIEELTFYVWLQRYRISFFISAFLTLASLPLFLQLSGSFSSGLELSAFAWVLSLTACIQRFPLTPSPNIRPWTRRALN